jgi:nucleoporin SEH1
LPANALSSFGSAKAAGLDSPGKRDNNGFQIDCLAKLSDHGTQVWRAQWNITGTVLASTGDDGTVRLWKAFSPGATDWKCISVIYADRV